MRSTKGMRTFVSGAVVWGLLCAASAGGDPATGLEPPTTPIELRHENLRLSDALTELGRQAGVRFDLAALKREDDLSISPNVRSTAFWPAVWDISRQGKVNIEPAGNTPRTLSVNRYSEPRVPSGPSCSWGGTFLLLEEASRYYDASYGSRHWRSAAFRISGRLYADPKLEVVAIKPEPIDLVAVDENGLSLVPAKPPELEWIASGQPGALIQGFTWNLSYPEGGGRRIASMRGKVLITLAEDFHTVTIESPRTRLPFRTQVPDGELVIESLTEVPDGNGGRGCELKVVLVRPAESKGPARDVAASGLSLTDGSGHVYERGGGGVNGGPKVTYTVRFSLYGKDAGPPERLTWRLPGRLTQKAIPFEFTDLPIPQ